MIVITTFSEDFHAYKWIMCSHKTKVKAAAMWYSMQRLKIRATRDKSLKWTYIKSTYNEFHLLKIKEEKNRNLTFQSMSLLPGKNFYRLFNSEQFEFYLEVDKILIILIQYFRAKVSYSFF